jgi:hypothetical protein
MNARDVEDVVVQLGASRGSTVMRAHKGAVYDRGALELDVDAEVPAKQMKWVPTAHAQGFQVIATEVMVVGAAIEYKNKGEAPITP